MAIKLCAKYTTTNVQSAPNCIRAPLGNPYFYPKYSIMRIPIITLLIILSSLSCTTNTETTQSTDNTTVNPLIPENMYVPFTLTTDLSALTDEEKQMLPLLIEAARIMDTLFMWQAYGDPAELAQLGSTDAEKTFVGINYGPWDRLNGNRPFLTNTGEKPLGATFYPADMTKEEFEAASPEHGKSLYTFVIREEDGSLATEWYHERFEAQLQHAATLLTQAAALAEDEGLKNYLTLRAEALLTDDFLASDLAWMDMKTNTLDIVIGPIETYEDQLFGYKASYEAYVLVKDQQWSAQLARFASMLPWLQQELPVPARYKAETPGSDADLNAYDVVYYAGDCNAGSKTIAINLPNDEQVQLEKGTRRLQLKNAMQAKFDKILVPIAQNLIAEDQRSHITFDAFFANTMFHEVAHGLGIKNTVTGQGTVREALQNHASAIEEGKADILGIYMVRQLHQRGELGEVDLMDYYVTFMAGIFRSIRFGSSSAHGIANLLRFNFFLEQEAFTKEGATYRVNEQNFGYAIDLLSKRILTLQGDGDYGKVERFIRDYGSIDASLQEDLNRINEAGIPVDIIFEQGSAALGL